MTIWILFQKLPTPKNLKNTFRFLKNYLRNYKSLREVDFSNFSIWVSEVAPRTTQISPFLNFKNWILFYLVPKHSLLENSDKFTLWSPFFAYNLFYFEHIFMISKNLNLLFQAGFHGIFACTLLWINIYKNVLHVLNKGIESLPRTLIF